MDGYGGGSNIQDPSKLQDLTPFGANPTDNGLFDASQYEFFGGDAVEEVELGGLEDEEDGLTPIAFEEEEFQFDKEEFQFDKEEGEVLGPLSEIDDLTSTFSKLNKVASGPASAGISRDWGSRESLSASELAENPAFNNWFDLRAYDAETIHESQNWPSHTNSSPPVRFMEANIMHRTSSYPEQHPQQPQNHLHQHFSEPPIRPISPFTSYPLPGGRSHQTSLNGLSDILYRPQIPGPNVSSFPHSQLSQLGGNLTRLPRGFPVNSQIQNQRVNQNSLYPGNHSDFPNNFSPQQNGLGLVPPQMMPPQQTRMPHPFQQSVGHLQAQSLNPHSSSPPPNFDMLGSRRNHPMPRYPPQGASGWPRFRSKYMTTNEIDNIHRAQLAATHSNDPYVEDYYHQAILARKSAGAKLRHHFCPTTLRDGSSRTRESNEPHPFLKVDALGRICFSSIRTPRPLLEVDSPKSTNNGGAELKPLDKPLEQEPMLAARVAIEDGICLLLEVDDIDRFLQFNLLPDGGAHLRQRRQVLLEGLASSLHLVDPLGKNGHQDNLAARDDFVFLRLASLPKGKKLLLRYLEVLSPGELGRIVCMAICRNLRFLFGNMPSDYELSTINGKLAKNVSSCARLMDLKSLAACLASVVCGAEHPPLRPIGHIAGDGASVILKSVLERATELLTDPHAVDNCSVHNRGFWQASFDAFFGMLTKYCFNKYDSALQSFLSQSSPDTSTIGSDVAQAIGKEMPVELLRASLPHTSEQQRKVLLEFAQRSMPVMGFSGSG